MKLRFEFLRPTQAVILAAAAWALCDAGPQAWAGVRDLPAEEQVQVQDRGSPDREAELKRLKEERRRFQDQELITARPLSLIFNPGDPPRIIWRDVDEVRRLGSDGRLRVRWFDADLNEAAKPTRPGAGER